MKFTAKQLKLCTNCLSSELGIPGLILFRTPAGIEYAKAPLVTLTT